MAVGMVMPFLIQYNQNMIKKNDKLGVTEIKNFCFVKGNVKRIRNDLKEGQSCLSNRASIQQSNDIYTSQDFSKGFEMKAALQDASFCTLTVRAP